MSEKRNNRVIYFRTRERKKERKNNRRVSKNFLDNLIKDAKKKRNLNDKEIKRRTIQDRVLKRRRNVLHPGHTSPMVSIEATLVTLISKMSSICQPLNCKLKTKWENGKRKTHITMRINSYWARITGDCF